MGSNLVMLQARSDSDNIRETMSSDVLLPNLVFG